MVRPSSLCRLVRTLAGLFRVPPACLPQRSEDWSRLETRRGKTIREKQSRHNRHHIYGKLSLPRKCCGCKCRVQPEPNPGRRALFRVAYCVGAMASHWPPEKCSRTRAADASPLAGSGTCLGTRLSLAGRSIQPKGEGAIRGPKSARGECPCFADVWHKKPGGGFRKVEMGHRAPPHFGIFCAEGDDSRLTERFDPARRPAYNFTVLASARARSLPYRFDSEASNTMQYPSNRPCFRQLSS